MILTLYGIKNCGTVKLTRPSIIKRPVVDLGNCRLVRFKADEWAFNLGVEG